MPYDHTFSEQTFEGRPFDDELESCTFTDCVLEEVDLSGLGIVDTTFQGCDMRMVKLAGARLQGVRFIDCRLAGIAFSSCSTFALAFGLSKCDASYTSFTGLKLRDMSFGGSVLKGADFEGADLSKADLSDTDLLDASFGGTNLTGADLRGAFNFDIHPETNRVQGAQFSRGSLDGLLRRYGIKISP